MSAIWSGPAYDGLPSRRPCSHVAPESCRYCDGTARDERELWAASRDAEKVRAKRMADPRQRAAWLASLPPLTRALIEPTWTNETHGGAA